MGKSELSKNQINYAANDVLYLHEIKEKLDIILERENRVQLANALFKFIPTKATLDLLGWNNSDIFFSYIKMILKYAKHIINEESTALKKLSSSLNLKFTRSNKNTI